MATKANKEIKRTDLGGGLVMIAFEDAAQPVFVEKKGKKYIYYGEKNDYPQYLLYLYNNSSKHGALINGKVDYIVGKGWTYETGLPDELKIKNFVDRANRHGETLKDILDKCALDYEIFNGAYLQVTWNLKGEIASVYHVDYTTVRSNKNNSEFYVSDEWVCYKPNGSYTTNGNPKFKTFSAYNPQLKKGTQILYVKKYHPGIETYTLPGYRGSITWIEVDIEIGSYHLTNVKSGFFANMIINMNNGNVSDEEKDTIEKQFKQKFSGVRGQRFMIAFNDSADNAATIESLSIAESDKIFDQLNKTAQQEIFAGHRIVSPMLFGIKTEGQLGGNSELRAADALFQSRYVNGKQQWLEQVFNMLGRNRGITSPMALTIQRTEPVAVEFSEATQAQNMTQDEIREKMGLPAVEKKEDDKAKDVINAINSLSPLVANKVLENLTSDELRSLIGLAPAAPGSIAPPASQFSAAEDKKDGEIFAKFGQDKSAFIIGKVSDIMFTSDEDEKAHFATVQTELSTLQEGILTILSKDPLTTQQVLAKALDTSLEMINTAIHELVDLQLLTVEASTKKGDTSVKRKPVGGAKDIVKKLDPETRSIQVMYSYEGPMDDRNRPFCRKLLELNRLYSRADIEKISTRLKYSVWVRRGGWYTVPGTTTHLPYCRHTWKSNVVVKRES